MTDANITSIVAPFGGDGAGFQDSSDLATKNELWHLTEEHVWPAMLAEAEEIALDHKKASDIDIAKTSGRRLSTRRPSSSIEPSSSADLPDRLLPCCSIDIQSTAPIGYYLEPGRRKVTCHVH